MAKIQIKPGIYTVEQLLEAFSFDLEEQATVQHGDSDPYVDHRRVQLGRLGFDDLGEQIVVPETAEELELTLDGEVVATAQVSSK